MRSPIETKVAAPAISIAVLIPLVTALYMLADEFFLDLTQGQVKALSAVGVALIPIIQFVIGYRAPHTPRPDAPVVDDEVVYDEPEPGSRRIPGRTYITPHSRRPSDETSPS